ncbi:alginate O-acetyltransferase AlgF [Roseibium sediminicola]|uniref:Alginate biosynthesis protein AlgF n=1 Tax=Roseibium sediminicola TaxID=2933272 RepID=A0ABT0GZ95_9HYPH|nr:alginate O-acetyltransferase AlgF [Roseibium sp. CAU 1639]MCK7614158.1 alginate O-acetyltransferase AlgF [Roseibium sp. CAU 1639]
MASITYLLLASAAAAQDGGLYEKAIDPNSAFIRALLPENSVARIESKSFSNVEFGLTPYVIVDPGEVEVSSGSATEKVSASSGRFYTAAFDASGAVNVIEDKVTTSPSKANLTFYNLTSHGTVDLFVPQAKANALSGVPAGQGQTVALKAPLTLDFAVVADGETKATVKTVKLTRGGGTTIIAAEDGGEISLWSVESTISR